MPLDHGWTPISSLLCAILLTASFIASIHAVEYGPDDKTFFLPVGMTGEEWLSAENDECPMPEIMRRIHASGMEYVIDTVLDGIRSENFEASYRVTLYRVEAPDFDSEPSPVVPQRLDWLHRLVDRPVRESIPIYIAGPWRVRVSDPRILAFIIRPITETPAWVTAQLGRAANDFLVAGVGSLFRLPRDSRGSLWLSGAYEHVSHPRLPPNQLNEHGAPIFAIHTTRNPADPERKSVLVTAHNNPYDDMPARFPNLVDGPWRARPLDDDDVIVLVPSARQPRWVAVEMESPGLVLKDFVVRHRGSPASDEQYFAVQLPTGEMQVAVRRYQSQCMKTTLVQLLDHPNTHIISEYYDDGKTIRSVSGRAKIQNLAQSLGHYKNEEPALAQSLEIIDIQNQRPVAQSIHTDHLDFVFRESPAMSLMTMLYICILAGPSDLLLSVEGGGNKLS